MTIKVTKIRTDDPNTSDYDVIEIIDLFDDRDTLKLLPNGIMTSNGAAIYDEDFVNLMRTIAEDVDPGFLDEAGLAITAGPYWCAECGTKTATTYVVTTLDPEDPKGTRTEVCLSCHDLISKED